MFNSIAQLTTHELKHVPDITDVETEARMGRFDTYGKFFPGVSENYFTKMNETLGKLVPTWNQNKTDSIAIYFNEGLRAECFSSGKIECIRKRKITNDIDMNIPQHYSLRISTSKEQPIDQPVLIARVRKFLKPKQLPKLLNEGSILKIRSTATVYLNRKRFKARDTFDQLQWKLVNPTYAIDFERRKVRINPLDVKFKPGQYIKIINLAGIIKGTPCYLGQHTLDVNINDIYTLTKLSNVQGLPPYLPTSWRSKKRVSYNLWNGMNIDMTETVYSNHSIQCCYDGSGKKSYEIEADWNLKHKTTQDFSDVIKHVLYSRN